MIEYLMEIGSQTLTLWSILRESVFSIKKFAANPPSILQHQDILACERVEVEFQAF